MASTTRLGLKKPGGGSTGSILPDEVVDIDDLNNNADKLDDAVGFKLCTSTTRPSTPFDGQVIRETDTKNLLYFSVSGSRWVPIDTPNAASDTLRDALFPTPVGGDAVYRTDKRWTERYWDATGAPLCGAGWYPDPGQGPVARLTTNAAASTPGTAGVFGAMPWNQEETDPYGMHDNVTLNTRIVPVVKGLYEVRSNIRFSLAAGVTGWAQVRKNGAADAPSEASTSQPQLTAVTSRLVAITSATDYITIEVTSGTASQPITSVACAVDIKYVRPV
jgi:hypothetical protein